MSAPEAWQEILDRTYVDDIEAEMRGVEEAGWYLLDDNGRLVSEYFGGPHETATPPKPKASKKKGKSKRR